MLIGVSTHIHVYSPLDEELLRRVREAGYETVELYANPPHWPRYDTVAGKKEIAEACLDLDLPVNSIHSPFFRNLDEARSGRWLSVTSRDPALRRESVERIIESVALAEFVPVGCVVVHLGAPEEKLDGGTYDRLYYSLEDILAETQRMDLGIALENITNEISRGYSIARFIEECDLEGIGGCYDCGHAAIYGRTVDELSEMAPYMTTTHIHDTTGGLDNHLMPFTGEIDWDVLAEAFGESDYDGALIIEAKDESGSFEALREGAEAADSLRDKILKARAELKNPEAE